MRSHLFLCCFGLSVALTLGGSGAIAAPEQAKNTPYGAMLEGFEYPYPVTRYDLVSQKQKLSMAYMDVAPQDKKNSNGKIMVLLHGKNFCAATWKRTIDTLVNDGYRVIAVDQVGFCKSSKPRDYKFSFDQLVENTHQLLAHLGVKKFNLMGHSIGGMLAMRYAINKPDAVEKLILVNPIGLEDWQKKGVPYAAVDALYAGELKTNYAGIRSYQQKYYYDGVWNDDYDHWVKMLAGMYEGAGRDIVAWNQAQTSEMLFTQPVIQEAGRIKAPTLLFIGEKDRTAPGANRAPKELAQQLGNYPVLARATAKAIPGARLILFPQMGHSPQVEAPEEFHAALLKELKN